jgi:hypothetical protein
VLVIGNPDDRRVALFGRALRSEWGRGFVLLPWIDVLREPDRLERALDAETLVRIESPGSDFAVWRELVALGAADRAREGADVVEAEAALSAVEERGRVRWMRQWYLGFCRALATIESALVRRPPHAVMNSPAAIRLCFDKAAVHDALAAAGVARPERLPDVSSFRELREAMAERRISQVFVKPRHGSTASGVIAFRMSGSRVLAASGLEAAPVGGEWRFYNSFTVRRYHREADVARIVDFVLAEGAVVERWLPKLTLGRTAVDLRVVVVGGRPLHSVGRASLTPVTNLHLRSRRLDAGLVSARVDAGAWTRGLQDAVAAASACGCGYAGVDLLFSSSGRRHAVLEVNAFGDLLPRLVLDGRDTYASELALLGEAA